MLESDRTCPKCTSKNVGKIEQGYYFCYDCGKLLQEIKLPEPKQILLPGL